MAPIGERSPSRTARRTPRSWAVTAAARCWCTRTPSVVPSSTNDGQPRTSCPASVRSTTSGSGSAGTSVSPRRSMDAVARESESCARPDSRPRSPATSGPSARTFPSASTTRTCGRRWAGREATSRSPGCTTGPPSPVSARATTSATGPRGVDPSGETSRSTERRVVRRGGERAAQRLGQRADQRGHQLLAQPGHEPAERVAVEGGEHLLRHGDGHAVVGGAGGEHVRQGQRDRGVQVRDVEVVGELLDAEPAARARRHVGARHGEQVGRLVAGLLPPGVEVAGGHDVGRDPGVVEGVDGGVVDDHVATAGALLDLADVGHERLVRGEERVPGPPVPLDQRVAQEQLSRQAGVDAGVADGPRRDERDAVQRDLLGRLDLPARGVPARFGVRPADQVPGDRLHPVRLDDRAVAREQPRRLDQLGRHHPARAGVLGPLGPCRPRRPWSRQHRAGRDGEPGPARARGSRWRRPPGTRCATAAPAAWRGGPSRPPPPRSPRRPTRRHPGGARRRGAGRRSGRARPPCTPAGAGRPGRTTRGRGRGAGARPGTSAGTRSCSATPAASAGSATARAGSAGPSPRPGTGGGRGRRGPRRRTAAAARR